MNTNLLEITKTNGDCAQYTGTVTVASYMGDRLIQKETHHNKGLNPLFDFIGSCLQGNWYEARDKRPCKLVMLTQAADECLTEEELKTAGVSYNKGLSSPTNNVSKDSVGDLYWSSKYAVCSPIMYDTTAITANTKESSSTTYHFRVPFLSLVGGSKIKKLMLLPPNATNYSEDACAYYILKNAITVPDTGANFTIVIEWTLKFTNSETPK